MGRRTRRNILRDNMGSITKRLREAVWMKYDGHCAYCGCEITVSGMQVDHVKAKYLSQLDGEDTDNSIENLMPACRQCNFYKATYSIEDFRNRLKETLLPNLMSTFQYRLAEKIGMVETKEWDGKFHFERCNDNK